MKRPLPARPGRPVRGSTTGRPVMALLDLLGRRWTLRVLWELRDGPVKFRELAQRADAMSKSVLSRRLNELETACFVTSDEDGWRLTDGGSELLRVFSPLSRFATRWAKLINQPDDESASWDASNRHAKMQRFLSAHHQVANIFGCHLNQEGSLLNRTANRAKMLTERDACVTAARCDVLFESSLLPEGRAELHAYRLVALRVPDAYRKLGYRTGLANWNKQNAIVVAQHKIVCRDDMLAESCGWKRERIHRVEALRSGRQGSQTKDWQANDAELSRIPMQTPDHDAGQARAAGFQCNQITNARLIQSATVVTAIAADPHVWTTSPQRGLWGAAALFFDPFKFAFSKMVI
jgi:DNA-binding HxlR family transcriptional regulator